MEDKRVKTSLW